MEHLIIKQGVNTSDREDVSMALIQKLYDVAKNSTLDNESDVQGRIRTAIGYREPIDWLRDRFPNLTIEVSDYAISFEDENMLTYLLSLGIGSNGMITEAQAAVATVVANSVNTTVRKFNELKYFTSVYESKNGFDASQSGNARFFNWTALEEVDISNFTSLGHNNTFAYEDTFSGCTSLKTVTASSKLKKIGADAFKDCSNLERITGLSGVITLASRRCFYECNKLENATFENCEILFSNNPNDCFQNCQALTSITLNAAVTQLPNSCFYGCSNLMTVNTSNITHVGQNAFNGCSSLQFYPSDVARLQNIGNNAFVSVKLIGDFVFPHLEEIGAWPFGNSGNYMTSCDFTGSTFTELRSATLEGQRALTSCILPETVNTISGWGHFGNCPLRWLKILSTTVPHITNDNGVRDMRISSSTKIYVQDSLVSSYKSNSKWSDVASQIYPLSQFPTDFPNG